MLAEQCWSIFLVLIQCKRWPIYTFYKETSFNIHHDNLYLHAIWQLFTSHCWLILPAALICMQHINIPQNRWPLIDKISNHSNFIKLSLVVGVNNGIYHITQLSSSCILLFCVKKCILLSIALIDIGYNMRSILLVAYKILNMYRYDTMSSKRSVVI
jgi:hypothetical protein